MKATHSSRPKRRIFKCRLHRLLTYHEEQSFTDRKNYSCFLGLLGGLKILMKITQPRPWHTAAAQPWWMPAARFTPTLPPLKTVARQAPLFMGFSRQEYWSGLPFPSPGHLPDARIEPTRPVLQADSLLTWATREACSVISGCDSWSISFKYYTYTHQRWCFRSNH